MDSQHLGMYNNILINKPGFVIGNDYVDTD